MKYIITWVLTTLTVGPCPIAVDEFGRKSTVQTSMACAQTYIDTLTRQFTSRADAIAFYNKALKEADLNQTSPFNFDKTGITDVKIDSLPIQ